MHTELFSSFDGLPPAHAFVATTLCDDVQPQDGLGRHNASFLTDLLALAKDRDDRVCARASWSLARVSASHKSVFVSVDIC
jgi:hypothetical protein